LFGTTSRARENPVRCHCSWQPLQYEIEIKCTLIRQRILSHQEPHSRSFTPPRMTEGMRDAVLPSRAIRRRHTACHHATFGCWRRIPFPHRCSSCKMIARFTELGRRSRPCRSGVQQVTTLTNMFAIRSAINPIGDYGVSFVSLLEQLVHRSMHSC
jgi:hypothetical protein